MSFYRPSDYHAQLMALLPRGPVWPRGADSVISRVMMALADALARFDARLGDLLTEADPSTALEMLGDWERLLGLPDPCVPADASIRARQRLAAQKLAARGGQSRAYFVELAAIMGYEIEIEEFSAFVAGSFAGDLLYGDDWAHAWNVRVLASSVGPLSAAGYISIGEFTAGSLAGEPLRTFEAGVLACILNRVKPAHTIIMISYDIDPEPQLWFDFLTQNGF